MYFTQQGSISPTVTISQSSLLQDRENKFIEQKRVRASALRIVDPDTNIDVLTGEKVVPSDVGGTNSLPMTPPPDFSLTPSSDIADKVSSSSIFLELVFFFKSCKLIEKFVNTRNF